jgi:hypothetical protein
VRIPEEIIRNRSETIVRTVHTTKKHPQIGYIFSEGKKTLVYIGFWLDMPVWKVANGPDDPEYTYCAERTMPIEEDPDYIGDESDMVGDEENILVCPITITVIEE